jgi:hypothetical protein
MTAIGYILDTEEIVKASCSNFQHHGVAAFILSEISPLPPALSPKDIAGGQTQALNLRQITSKNCRPVESNEDSAHESLWDSKN